MIRLCYFVLALTVAAIFLAHPSAAAPAPLSDAELTREECGACHYVYARNWLPAYAWKEILDHLGDHFGDDASLDDRTRERIATYLYGGRPTDIPIRVTDTDWWLRAHGGESIKQYAQQKGFSVSSCEKCHR